MKKTFLIASLAALCLAVPAAAETFTTDNEVLSIETPNEEWKKIEDPGKLLSLSDGSCLLTVEHFANGEDLPEIATADENHANVFQAAYSTKNEVFILTGFADEEEDFPEICNMIMSAKVLKRDTKTAVKKEEPKASEISIVPMDETMYVTANSLNVRLGCSTEDKSIGALTKGAFVWVKGKVQKNGADIGWVQIDFNGATGYVSSNFLSKEAPKKEAQPAGESFLVYGSDGISVLLTPYSDGFFYTMEGVRFTDNGNYTYTSADGALYTVEPPVFEDDNVAIEGDPYGVIDNNAAEDDNVAIEGDPYGVIRDKYLESQGSKRPVTIHFEGGAWFDKEGNEFADQNDGTFIEVKTGDVFDFIHDVVE